MRRRVYGTTQYGLWLPKDKTILQIWTRDCTTGKGRRLETSGRKQYTEADKNETKA